MIVDEVSFVVYLNAQFPNPFYADFFVVLLMAMDSQQEISNQPGKNLHHKAILAPGNQMVNSEVAFPPCEEFLDIPSEFVNKGDLFCC